MFGRQRQLRPGLFRYLTVAMFAAQIGLFIGIPPDALAQTDTPVEAETDDAAGSAVEAEEAGEGVAAEDDPPSVDPLTQPPEGDAARIGVRATAAAMVGEVSARVTGVVINQTPEPQVLTGAITDSDALVRLAGIETDADQPVVAAGSALLLRADGVHVVIDDIEIPFEPGDDVIVGLVFEPAGLVPITVRVVEDPEDLISTNADMSWRRLPIEQKVLRCTSQRLFPTWCAYWLQELADAVTLDRDPEPPPPPPPPPPEPEPLGPPPGGWEAVWRRIDDGEVTADMIEMLERRTLRDDALSWEALGYIRARGLAGLVDYGRAYEAYGNARNLGLERVTENMDALWPFMNQEEQTRARARFRN